MNYEETINYLFTSAPLFQNIGKGAYKEGLETSIILDKHFGFPHKKFMTIHVAGTNGKGSCSHTIAAILQQAGYRVGLYTSPHLIDFRERIKINGEMISREYVVNFVREEKSFFEPLHPSFFELTTSLAFKYFAEQKVDVAVIEVGLGGRLDCTNIINPIISIITNISFDHTAFLGSTIKEIASEKAGIIKENTDVVIGEANIDSRHVFEKKAEEKESPIVFAEDAPDILSSVDDFQSGGRIYKSKSLGILHGKLGGLCQEKNTNTILCAIKIISQKGFSITEEHIRKGFANVCEDTGLMGRWQKLQSSPNIICDTGHNVGGWEYISMQLQGIKAKHLHIIFGMVNDKDITSVLKLMPQTATYYFTKANVKRALNENEIREKAKAFSLIGKSYPSVKDAYNEALRCAGKDDFIYIGGSSFIVADLLQMRY